MMKASKGGKSESPFKEKTETYLHYNGKSNKKYQVKNVADSYAIMDASQKVLVVFSSAALGKDKAKVLAKSYCDMLNTLLD